MKRFSDELKIYFRPRKTSGKTFLYCRLILNGVDATDFSVSLQVTPDWNQTTQVFDGIDEAAIQKNNRLADVRAGVGFLYRNLSKGGTISVHELRRKYLNKRQGLTLLEASNAHLKLVKSRLGHSNYSAGTLKAHQSLHKHIVGFLEFKRRKDVVLTEIDTFFAKQYVDFLKYERKYTQNFVVKSLNRLKFLIDEAVLTRKLDQNPLTGVKEEKVGPGPIVFLTDDEIERLKDHPLFSEYQQRVADTFLFQCYTGLSYCDLSAFRPDRHLIYEKGRPIIQFSRKKTDVPFTIPVLPFAMQLLDKYDGKLPVLTNQKMNEYLKEIASIAGIKKRLTTHIGRKTAGTYLLNKDVPIKTVSNILGHSSVKITEKVYAHLLTDTILRHTAHLVEIPVQPLQTTFRLLRPGA